MTDGAWSETAAPHNALPVPEGVPADEFVNLIAIGKERGTLTPDDLMPVLKTVELTPELIDAVVNRVRADGILYEDPDEVVHEEPLDVPTDDEIEEARVGQRRAKRRLAALLGR